MTDSKTRMYRTLVTTRAIPVVPSQNVRRSVAISSDESEPVWLKIYEPGDETGENMETSDMYAAPLYPATTQLALTLEPGQAVWGLTRGVLGTLRVTIEYLDGPDPNGAVPILKLQREQMPMLDRFEKECLISSGCDSFNAVMAEWQNAPEHPKYNPPL